MEKMNAGRYVVTYNHPVTNRMSSIDLRKRIWFASTFTFIRGVTIVIDRSYIASVPIGQTFDDLCFTRTGSAPNDQFSVIVNCGQHAIYGIFLNLG